jgi:5-methylcytosine-specific restriction protein B
MTSDVYEDDEPTIRRSLLLETLFDVLGKADHPLPSSEVLAQVAEAVELTPHEASPAAGGKQRAETFLRFGSSWATTLGWVTKKGGRWSLTEAGVEALDHITDKSTLYPVLSKLYRQEMKTPGGRRAWLVRGASVNGLNLVPTWLAKGSCSVAASRLRPIEPPVSREEIAAIVEDDYSHVSYNARNEKVAEFDAFVNRMQADDIVVTTSGGDFYVGRIAGDCTYVKSPDDRSNLRRDVAWANADSPVDFADLPDALTVKLSSQHAIVDLTNEIGNLEGLLSKAIQPGSDEVPETPAEVTLPDATDELAERLLVDRLWLQEQIELLRDRRQLIFYGPPGTGKTYLAQAIAEHLTDREAIKLVQFHPAYSYEDFFEGFRPVSSADGSGVAFQLSPGPFRRLVDAARENPGTAYVLIIDEINRANLAKVFGELYFLLEYRGHAIDLLYSAGDEAGFTLPKNVYLIGTMNTADRSIALVDTAMRRRFAFTALHPSEEPTSGVLAKWLAQEGHSQTSAQVLGSLNGLIEDEDFKIGPSYFMRDSAQTEAGLQRVWRSSILPLLEEHHYGESIDVAKRYDLARILRKVAPVEPEPAVVSSDEDGVADLEQEPDEVL